MAEEHILDANLSTWADEIRLVGNVGAHFDPIDDVTLAEATDLAKLTRQLLHYVYELPASIQRKRGSRQRVTETRRLFALTLVAFGLDTSSTTPLELR